MIKSKLFVLLETLSKDELDKFGDFLRSPFFNKSAPLVKLFSVYRKYYPEFNNKNFTKEKVFAAAFPGKNFKEALLRNYNSDLLKLGEDFLIQLNLNRSEITPKRHLLSELNMRNIHSLFESSYKSALKKLENSESRDTSYHYDRYFIKQEKDLYNSFMKNFSPGDKKDSEESFINFFLSVLMEMYAYIINQRDVLKVKYDFILFDELVKLVESKSGMLAPVVLMHFNRLMLHHTGQEKYYLLLKEQADKHGSLTETVNHFDTYICLINYVRKYKDTEKTETIRELFELRKIIIEKNILVGENYISHNVFHNQVKSGLKLKEFEYVRNFIESYKGRLLESVRHNTYHYSLATYYYETGNNRDALKHLLLITGSSFDILEIKNLAARIYWQENDFDLISSSLASYKQYIAKNRKLDKDKAKNHSGFIAMMEKLFRYKYDGKKIDLGELKKEALNSAIVYKKWVVDSIDAINPNS